MNTPISSSLMLLIACFGLAFLSPERPVFYKINEGSELYISGNSNVAKFKCHCTETLPESKTQMQAAEGGAKIKFSQTILKLTTKLLDCHNVGMSHDLHKGLKAKDYPYIKIELNEASLTKGALAHTSEQWKSLEALTTITIAGVSKQVMLDVQAKRTGLDSFRFKSVKKLLMTDFGIDPPRPMLGIIKVEDEIMIHFDMAVTIIDGQ